MTMIKSPSLHLLLFMVVSPVIMAVAELQRFEHMTKPDGSLSFLVVGDWGRRGLYNQSNVAFQMSKRWMQNLQSNGSFSRFTITPPYSSSNPSRTLAASLGYGRVPVSTRFWSVPLGFDLTFMSIGTRFRFVEHVAFVDDSIPRNQLESLLDLLEHVEFMGKVGEKMDVDFIVSTGDNFYDSGLVDEDDPAFFESFTNVYTAPSLQKQWYSVLGNHDYRGNALAQLSPVLTQRDNKWLCLRSFILSSVNVEFFFVDTTPFQEKYFTETDQTYDWRGVVPVQDYISGLLKDVEVALKESKAKWKIVVGHHTIFSGGVHGSTQELVDRLLPILQENEVNLYINGHDHCLQHISSSNSQLQFLTSGGGSKAWRGEFTPWNLNEMKFYYDGQGFMAAEVTDNELYLAFYDIFGNILHKWSASKETHSAS